MKPILEIKNISKKFRIRHEQQPYLSLRDSLTSVFKNPFHQPSYEAFWALKDVSFDVFPGESIGIIGKNGAGKSTLLKILSKITPPSEGKIISRGRIASLLEVGTGFHPELTGRENIFLNGSILGMKRKEIQNKFDEIVDFSGVEKFLDTPLKHYSSGMQLRLAFAVAAFLEPEILLVDEVLAVGDAEFQKKCLGKMDEVTKNGRTILFVSHNIGALQHLCKRGIILKKGMVDFSGMVRESTEYYLHSILSDSSKNTNQPNVLFDSPNAKSGNAEMSIIKISLHDENGKAKSVVATWDNVGFRIEYKSKKRIEHGSVVLQVKTFDGAILLLLSTQPDSTLPLQIKEGKYLVECMIKKLPLASGNYLISAGLAIPNSEWLCWQQDIATLAVSPNDVYHSGLAPAIERSLLVVEHSWKKIN